MALFISATRKVEAELGASVSWGCQSATLRVPSLELTGDPLACQRVALSVDVEGFFDKLTAIRPDCPHVVILFAHDSAANRRASAEHYHLAEVMSIMVADLGRERAGASEATVRLATADDEAQLVGLDERSAVYLFDPEPCSNSVALVEDRIVGKTQVVEAVPGVGYLTDMVVDEAIDAPASAVRCWPPRKIGRSPTDASKCSWRARPLADGCTRARAMTSTAGFICTFSRRIPR